MKRLAWTFLTCLFAATGCGGDDDDDDDDDGDAVDAAPTADAAAEADAGEEADAGVDPVERGEYLVEVVGACGDCHTPRNKDGSLDETRHLGGNPSFVDVDDDPDIGNLPTPNLTPDATGLGDWTDDEIKDAFLNGIGRGDDPLFPVMPYYVLHNMTDEDADAIVAYLATVPVVEQEIPDPQEPFDIAEPADPFPAEAIPDTTLDPSDTDYEEAQRGRYLAGFIGVCMECHTARTNEFDPSSLDPKALFAGDEPFDIGDPFGTVYSANITPDEETGIGLWSVAAVRAAIKEGIDFEDEGLCPPMPVGPDGPFGGFSDEDADAIGRYLLTIEPIENEITEECSLPPPRL